ncbi:transcription initiation factor TFIID subunit 2, partial [Elysia marginata]
GYVELTVWPAVPDLTEIRINSKQCSIYRINIDKKWDAEFTYFDPMSSIGQGNPVKRNLDFFQKCNKNCLNSVDPDCGNGELVIKLPTEVLPAVTALGSFQMCVEFSVQQPQGGVHFVVPDMPGSMAERSAHMFTYGVENSSRMWFPCMDSFFDPCTWKIEVTVDAEMTAVSCGDLVSVEYNEEMTEKTYHYFLSTPVAAPNIALAVGPFKILVDPKMHEVTHFCLPGLMPVLKHTTSYIHQAFEFYEELMSSRYPYSYYKQVFVDMAYCDVATYSTLSILSTNLLHPPNIIDQTMVSRQLMAAAVAQQFFGSFIAMETWCDAWLTKGITGYLSYLFTKRTFGNNEYRQGVMKDVQEVCKYEHEVGPVVLDPSQQLDSVVSAHHPFWCGSPHTLSPRYAEVLAKKARLIVRMLEMRIGTELLLQVLNKLLSLAYNASQAPFSFGSWTNMLLSTSSQGGCARFTGSFVFNRKRNVVELDIKQDLTAPGALKFVGTLNVTIQELDGSFNHQFKIEENKTKFEITCHSKSRRNKKKKIPLMTGEEVDMDLSAMDADSPVLWLRLDPDMQVIRTVHFEQPDYMWQYQLKFERCIVAQFEAIEALGNFATPASRYALNATIENEECYYRVRQEACHCLAKIANLMTGTWTGPPAMMTIFRKLFGSHSCPVIVRQNNFSNLHHYHLLKTMPQAMARLRDTHNLCLADITKFLLDLFKYNDNSRNKWSDNYYRAALVDALAATITPAITNVSLLTGQDVTAESLSTDMRLVLEEIVRCLNLEKLMQSYRFTVSVSCLHAIRTLQKFGHLPNESDVFKDYAQPGLFRDVRVAAVTCLVDFIKGDLTGEHLKWVLDFIEKDADPFLRHHALTSLIENPPFRRSERSALNVESLAVKLTQSEQKTRSEVSGQAEPGTTEGNAGENGSPRMGASSMWNQELSSIFAPPGVLEVSEVVTEETVITDFPPPTIKPDLVHDAADESMEQAPVDLTMISGETVVAMEESVVTESAASEDLKEIKTEPLPDTPATKLEVTEEIALEDLTGQLSKDSMKHDTASHLSEDSASPGHSPSKGGPDDVVSLDNIIKGGSSFSEDTFAEKGQSPPFSPSVGGGHLSPSSRRRASDTFEGEENVNTDKPTEELSQPPTPLRSPVHGEESSLPAPRRRSLRSLSSQRASPPSPFKEIEKVEEDDEDGEGKVHHLSPSRLSSYSENEDDERRVVEEIILDQADSTTPPKSPASELPASPPLQGRSLPAANEATTEQEEAKPLQEQSVLLSPKIKHSPPSSPSHPTAVNPPSPSHTSTHIEIKPDPEASEVRSTPPAPPLPNRAATEDQPATSSPPPNLSPTNSPTAKLDVLKGEECEQEDQASSFVSQPDQADQVSSFVSHPDEPQPLSSSPPPPSPPPSVEASTQDSREKPVLSLKRKLAREDFPTAEPEYKRVVPPLILSSTAESASVVAGSSGQPSLKTTLKISTAGVNAGDWEHHHHHHHKSKKKKKKNKHKHKHKHKRDRQDNDDREGEEPRPRERLVLDMSSRTRVAVSEEEGSSD